MKTLAWILALVSLAGCAGMGDITQERQQVASGYIGCPPDVISVKSTGNHTWEATCKAKVFYCSVAPDATCTAQL